MNRFTWSFTTLAAVAGALVVPAVWGESESEPIVRPGAAAQPIAAEDEKDDDFDSKVAKFMRKKLDASQLVLEGLVTEDFEMIAKGAKSMEAMSRASDWQMIKGPIYKQFSSEFRKTCEDLVGAAEEENVDAAGLAYMRLTMGCITCHNFVRTTMMADTPVNGDGHAR